MGVMIGRAVLGAGLLLAFGGAGGAWAQNFDFRYSGPGGTVMGTFVTTAQGNGQYLITSIVNGFRGGNAITLVAPGAQQNAVGYNDNLLSYPATPYFDQSGFAFTSAGNAYRFNYFNGRYTEIDGNGAFVSNGVTVAASPAPASHPGGGLLSFLALGLFGLVSRRRMIAGRAPSRPVPVSGLDRVRGLILGAMP